MSSGGEVGEWKRIGSGPAPPHGRRAAYLFMGLYALYLVEGALRKWVLPEWSNELFFLRDPFAFALYLYCAAHKLYERSALSVTWLITCLFTSAIGLIQYMAEELPLSAFILAVRSYWLYMPLVIILPAILDRKALRFFLLAHLMLCIPIAVLVAMQYFSEPTSFVNIGALPEENAVMFAGERGRPLGVFQYYSVNVVFVAAAAGLAVAAVAYLKRNVTEVAAVVAAWGALAVLISFTGSRRIWFLVGTMFLAMLAAAVLGKGWARRVAVGSSLAGIAGVAAVFFVYEDLWSELSERIEEAGGIEEGLWERIQLETVGFVGVLSEARVFGHGLGIGTTTVVRLLDLPVFWLGEVEGDRVVRELGPIIGLSYLAVRLVFGVWLVVRAFDLARRGRGEAIPMAVLTCVLFQSTGLGLSYSSVIGFQGWVAAGLTLAIIENARVGSSKSSSKRDTERSAKPALVDARRAWPRVGAR